MKILDTYEVKLSGLLNHHREVRKREFFIQNDSLEISTVLIPEIDYLIDCFRWLSDNDALRHLKDVTPDFQTNDREIEDIQRINYSMKDPLYRDTSYAIALPYGKRIKPVPPRSWTAVWTFFSRQHAVMFKLAKGGESDLD